MRSARAGRVSRGGRRKSTEPPGNDIMRKKAASIALAASLLRIHEGSSPSAETPQPRAITKTASASARIRLRGRLREHFNLHLPGSNVVGDILGGDSQLVSAGDGLPGNNQLASIGGSLGIPLEFDGRRAIETRDESARALRGVNYHGDCLAALETLAVELDLDNGRLAGDHKRLRLAIGLSETIAQDKAHGVSAILHVGGCEKAGLPHVFGGEISKRLHQSEGKQRNYGHDGLIGFDAQYRIARAYDARAQ